MVTDALRQHSPKFGELFLTLTSLDHFFNTAENDCDYRYLLTAIVSSLSTDIRVPKVFITLRVRQADRTSSCGPIQAFVAWSAGRLTGFTYYGDAVVSVSTDTRFMIHTSL